MTSHFEFSDSSLFTYWHGLLVVSILMLIGLFAHATYAAGYRSENVNGIKIGGWYPSNTLPILQRLGPFETEMAVDSPIANGQFQIVLFSHGNSGNYRNHYLTAQALDHRYFILQSALYWLQNHADFRQHIDKSKVHGVGYSLGGASIMLASGAAFSSSLVDLHYDRNEDVDAEFCEDAGFILRFIKSFRHDPTLVLNRTLFDHLRW